MMKVFVILHKSYWLEYLRIHESYLISSPTSIEFWNKFASNPIWLWVKPLVTGWYPKIAG